MRQNGATYILRCLAVVLLTAMSWQDAEAGRPGISLADIRERIDSNGTDPICGIWQLGEASELTDGAVTFAVVRAHGSASGFDIILVDSPDMSALPGTNLGSARSTGRPGIYDADLSGTNTIGGKKSVKRCIMNIDAEGKMSIRPYKQGHKFRFWRWLPYMLRMTMTKEDTRPREVDGASRIYPSGAIAAPMTL